jgi:hypothetical protein
MTMTPNDDYATLVAKAVTASIAESEIPADATEQILITLPGVADLFTSLAKRMAEQFPDELKELDRIATVRLAAARARRAVFEYAAKQVVPAN